MKHFSALPSWTMHHCQHVYFPTFKQYWKSWRSSQRGKDTCEKNHLSRTWEMGMSKFIREEIHMNILEGMAWSAVAVRALAISNQWHFSLECQIFFLQMIVILLTMQGWALQSQWKCKQNSCASSWRNGSVLKGTCWVWFSALGSGGSQSPHL